MYYYDMTKQFNILILSYYIKFLGNVNQAHPHSPQVTIKIIEVIIEKIMNIYLDFFNF